MVLPLSSTLQADITPPEVLASQVVLRKSLKIQSQVESELAEKAY